MQTSIPTLKTLRRWPCAALAAALPVLAACASYPERTAGALRAFQRGHLSRSLEAFEDPDTTRSTFLSGAEVGTVALAAGKWDAALSAFARAAEEVEGLEQRALVSGATLAEGVGSWALNDTVRPYRGEGFERVYLHCGLALGYLAKGQLDDVWVEVRLANQLLEAEEELYETSYGAGGLGHFLSALAYEILGQLDDAYIDYRRMDEKGVGTQIAGRALVRIATELGWDEDARLWGERFGPDLPRPPGAANIVVVAGVGLAPFKEEGKLVIPTEDGLVPIAVPSFHSRPQTVNALRLRLAEGEVAVRTDVIEDVATVAEENLGDRLAWIAAKSAARGLLKRELTKELEEEMGGGGRVLGDLFAFFSERADLRSWQTLPDTWQACRMFVEPGRHGLVLEAIGGETIDLGTFELEPGETMVILARTVGGLLFAHAIGGQPVEDSRSEAQEGTGEWTETSPAGT